MSIGILFIAFIAGVLTVLAPCILPILPVIVGGSVSDGKDKRNPYVIIGSLVLAIVLFTLLLKWSTVFIGVSQEFWRSVSGVILVIFSITMIFPSVWEKIPLANKLNMSGNKLLGKGFQKKSFWGDVVMGAALGPVFSSCSPTYFVILATVLPASFAFGILALFFYGLGLGLVLLLISVLGQRVVEKLGVVANPHGWFKRGVGILFLIIGLLVFTGVDKKIESHLLEQGFYSDLSGIEINLLQKLEGDMGDDMGDAIDSYDSSALIDTDNIRDVLDNTTKKDIDVSKVIADKAKKYSKYVEITDPSGGYVNTDDMPFKIADYIGQKVILVDFMTYSCINCIRTFPYLNDWYTKYEDDGLVIIGVHTPEFAFEKDLANVKEALDGFDIKFPVVLDNDYGTFRAWGNSYWPRKYLIDIDGFVVYDHIGEGEYKETEEKIVDALVERYERLGNPKDLQVENSLSEAPVYASSQSPETYFGTLRNANFYDADLGKCTIADCSFDYDASKISKNKFALDGSWDAQEEYAESTSSTSKLGYVFNSGKVFLVAEAAGDPITANVYLDGKLVSSDYAGADVVSSKVQIDEPRLYEILNFKGNMKSGLLEIEFIGSGARIFTFTFGL
ncbi:redoxin family protein [Candidatus Nomurabacteria bacterium]|nr:redoxin family protein [Candidatus Nomurabacteria bacterium]